MNSDDVDAVILRSALLGFADGARTWKQAREMHAGSAA